MESSIEEKARMAEEELNKEIEAEEKLNEIREEVVRELWRKGEISQEEFEKKFGKFYDVLLRNGIIELRHKIVLSSQAKLEAIKSLPILKDFEFAEIETNNFGWVGYTYRFDENTFFELVYLKAYDTFVFVDWKNKVVFEVYKVVENGKTIIKERPKWIDEITKNLNNFLVIDNFSVEINYENLFDAVVDYFKSQVYLLNEEDYLIETAFTIATWVPEIQNIAPFLRFYAPKGSGKTTNLEAISRLAYRSILSVNPTFASIPRLAHFHNAFLPIDEATVKGDELEAEDNVWDILRARNRRGMNYVKADSSNPFGIIGLEVFGLTVISGKKPIPDDIEDRCFRIELQKKVGFKPKKPTKKEVETLIEQLSKFRLWAILNNKIEGMRSVIENIKEVMIDAGFESRFVDIVAPLLFLIPKKYHDKIIPYMRERQIWRLEEDRTSEEALVFQAVYEILKDRAGGEITLENFHTNFEISIFEIAQKFAQISDTDFDSLSERDRRSLTTRTGQIIRKLGFKSKRKREGSFAIVSFKVFKELLNRYSVEEYDIKESVVLPTIDDFISSGETCETCETLLQEMRGGGHSYNASPSLNSHEFEERGVPISRDEVSHVSQVSPNERVDGGAEHEPQH